MHAVYAWGAAWLAVSLMARHSAWAHSLLACWLFHDGWATTWGLHCVMADVCFPHSLNLSINGHGDVSAIPPAVDSTCAHTLPAGSLSLGSVTQKISTKVKVEAHQWALSTCQSPQGVGFLPGGGHAEWIQIGLLPLQPAGHPEGTVSLLWNTSFQVVSELLQQQVAAGYSGSVRPGSTNYMDHITTDAWPQVDTSFIHLNISRPETPTVMQLVTPPITTSVFAQNKLHACGPISEGYEVVLPVPGHIYSS